MRLLAVLLALAALAGCLKGPAPAADEPAPPAFGEPFVFEDTIRRVGGEVATTKTFPVSVPSGATAVQATLLWGGQVNLQLTLRPPGLADPLRAIVEKPGRASLATTETPRAGEWEARVTSTSEQEAFFELLVTVHDGPPALEVAEATVRLLPGRVAEANVVLEAGATITWDYRSTEIVTWDVHTHDPGTGRTETPESGEGDVADGRFTAPRSGLYSFSLIAGDKAATVEYRVEGVMRVHSFSQS